MCGSMAADILQESVCMTASVCVCVCPYIYVRSIALILSSFLQPADNSILGHISNFYCLALRRLLIQGKINA